MNPGGEFFGLVRIVSWMVALVGTFWAAGVALRQVRQDTDDSKVLLSRTRWFFVVLLLVSIGTNLLPRVLESESRGFWLHLGISVGSAVLMVGVAVAAFRVCFRKP